MDTPKRLLSFLTTVSIFTMNLGFAGEESVNMLFEKALFADPADYAELREEIIDKGQDALVILEGRKNKTSNWYEKAIATALILAIASPEKYQNYQEEFDITPYAIEQAVKGGAIAQYSLGKDKIFSESPSHTVPFLIEKIFKEQQEQRKDTTVIGWHYSQPVGTAAVFMQAIGGNDAARAVAVFLLYVEKTEQDLRWDSPAVTSRRRGQEQLELSRLPDHELGTAMIGLLQKDSFFPSAAWVLGELRDTRAIKPLIETLTDIGTLTDWEQQAKRSHSATALAKIGETAIPSLIEALCSPKREIRSWASTALGRMGPVAVPHLIKEFHDGPEVAQYDVVRALRFIGDSRAVPVLIKCLESDDLSIVNIAATALGEIGDPAAKEALVRALENPKNWHSSGTSIFGIAGALATFEEPDAFPRLSVLATDDNWYLRRAAIEALPAVGGDKSLPILLELIKHEHATTRGDAAIALGKLGDPKAVPALIKAISDPERSVVTSAAWSLGEIGDLRALTHLRKMSSQTEGNEQRIANEAIKKIEIEASKSKQ